MEEPVSIIISSLSMVVAGVTLWLSYLRWGTIKMTQPMVVYFGPDGGDGGELGPLPKVFLRALLVSTSSRGHVIESMYIRLRRGESSQLFTVWTYGERGDLVRGSGLRVGPEGVACNHHFLLPRDGTDYEFLRGDYEVEVFATLLGRKDPMMLRRISLHLSPEMASALKGDAGIYFDWEPEAREYQPHARSRPAAPALPSIPFLLPFPIGDDTDPPSTGRKTEKSQGSK